MTAHLALLFWNFFLLALSLAVFTVAVGLVIDLAGFRTALVARLRRSPQVQAFLDSLRR
jgi:hypothetical protein